MKRLFVLLSITLCFLLQGNAMAAGTATKIGIVDLDRCMKESNEGKRISDSYKKDLEAMQQKYVAKQKELSDLQKDIEKQSLMLSQDAKQSKQNDYDKKTRELNYLATDLDEDAQTAKTNANQTILKTVYAVIQGVAKQQSFDLILEKSTAGIVFSSDTLDITNDIIKELNKAKP